MRSEDGILPATKFAVDAYVRFVRERTLLEAVASSLTELFAPKIHEERIPGLLQHYSFVSEEMVAYFRRRLDQAPRDAGFALAYVRRHADTAEKRQAVAKALIFKCNVLWAQLDALHHAYVLGGGVPMGAFVPAGRCRAGRRHEPGSLAETDRVALPAWVRLHFDRVRDRWVLLAPERVLFPCATSVTILERLDGGRAVGGLVDELARRVRGAARDDQRRRARMLQGLADQGFLAVDGRRSAAHG